MLTAGLCGPDARVIDVPPLGVREVIEILRDRVGPDAISQQTAIGIFELAGGNPFFVVEIGRAVALGKPPSPGGLLPIPTTLRAVVCARLSALSPRGRETLLYASALRRPTSTLLLRGGRDQVIVDLAESSWLGLTRLEGYLDFEPKVQKVKRDLLKFLIAAKEEGKRRPGGGADQGGQGLALVTATEPGLPSTSALVISSAPTSTTVAWPSVTVSAGELRIPVPRGRPVARQRACSARCNEGFVPISVDCPP